MYPIYSNGNCNYPLDRTLPPYTQEDHPPPHPPPSSLSYNFPSPAIPYEDDILLRRHLHDLLLQHPAQTVEASPPEIMTSSVHKYSNTQCLQSANEPVSRKKSSKKDRHSKIETAQGPRDRRMRLSLEVAPQFFGLQDMLGFDKASKTVGWLLSKSNSAIKELKKSVPRMAKSASSYSEGEDGSGIDESSDRQAAVKSSNNPKGKGSVSVAKDKKMNRALRKSAFNPLAKESREKARARARERTREKRSRVQFNEPNLSNSEAINNHDPVNALGSWHAFENGNGSGRRQIHNVNPSMEFEEPSSSINMFRFDPNDTRVSQENQFTDYQVYGKPWESCSSTISPF